MNMHPIFIVTVTVWLGLASALVLKEAANYNNLTLLLGAVVLAVILALNAMRFVLWGMVYKKHPVSNTYPLGATIFPLILIVGHYRYEESASPHKIVASLMIMAGVAVLSAKTKTSSYDVVAAVPAELTRELEAAGGVQ